MSRRSHAGGRTRHRAGGHAPRDNGRRPASPPDTAASRVDPPPIGAPGPRVERPSPQPVPRPADLAPPPPPSPPQGAPPPAALPPAVAAADAVARVPAAEPIGCTAPQLRRFIKSRAYVPLHELRRRFGINGADDDVTPIDLDDGRVYIGLPRREGEMMGDLLRGGEIGYELSFDPRTPVVVGVYPMRPVPRP